MNIFVPGVVRNVQFRCQSMPSSPLPGNYTTKLLAANGFTSISSWFRLNVSSAKLVLGNCSEKKKLGPKFLPRGSCCWMGLPF